MFRAEEFLPSIDGDCAKLWSWVDKVRAEVESATLRRVLDLFFADDDFRVRFERTPASTGGHHAKLGGLLMHVYEVTNIAKQTARTMKANVDLAVTGALLHDIGKVESYEIGPGGFTFTPCGLLLGHVVLGTLMLERRVAAAGGSVCSDAQLTELHHMILSHHGALEFGSPVTPMTTEAEIVHWADEASAKATDMIELLGDNELFSDGREFSDKPHWRLKRRIWRRGHEWE
jgi:3'-5' exoribonuclease